MLKDQDSTLNLDVGKKQTKQNGNKFDNNNNNNNDDNRSGKNVVPLQKRLLRSNGPNPNSTKSHFRCLSILSALLVPSEEACEESPVELTYILSTCLSASLR